MADDAGFAVALTLTQQLLQNALLIAYANNKFPRSLNTADIPGGIPGGPPSVVLDVFIGPPAITADTGNTLTLALELWGPVSITTPTFSDSAQIDAHLTISIVPMFTVADTALQLILDTDTVSVSQWTFTIPSGNLSAAGSAYLAGADFMSRLASTIALAVASGMLKLPSIDISFLGPLAGFVDRTTSSRARQGAILIGLSITTIPNLVLTGDADLLTNFAGANDLAAFVNARAIPLLLQDVQKMIADQVANDGATLDGGGVSISPGPGKFLLAGKGSRTGATASFSFSAVPTMFASKPGAYFQYLKKPFGVKPRTWPALGFAIEDVVVDIQTAWWVDLSTVLAGLVNAVLPLIVIQIVKGISGQIVSGIQGAPTPAPIPLVQHVAPAAPGGPVTRIELTAYDISTDGTFFGITVTPQVLPPKLIGLTAVPANYLGQTLNYTARLPLGLDLNDSTVRIAWTLTDAVSGNLLVTQDNSGPQSDLFGFVPAVKAPGLTQLHVTVRIYRSLGSTITEIFDDSLTLVLGAPLPAGAYVRWYYDVKNPNVSFSTATNAWAYTGDAVVHRHSKYHRTDSKHCEMEPRRSRYIYQQEIFDTLPFAISDIALHREELCDYCFYGGPAGVRPSL